MATSPEVLLAHFRALLGRAPDFATYRPTSQPHLTWLGQAHALLSRWSRLEAASFQVACDFLPMAAGREKNIANILAAIHRAIADLELQVPAEKQVAFGAGDVYDFFRALRNVVGAAEISLFIVDPYMDATIFDHYLSARAPDVAVRLLIRKYGGDVKAAADNYVAQHDAVVEVRQSTTIHDRVVFVDDHVCWVVGQSIKDAAKGKPTYLVPLPPDVTLTKLQDYLAIWDSSRAI